MKSSSKVSVERKKKSASPDWTCYNCKKPVGAYEVRINNEIDSSSPLYIWVCSKPCETMLMLKLV